jgi:uncharacterized Zn ribbon protein
MIYNCDICDHPTAYALKTDLGIMCQDCAEEANERALQAVENAREMEDII